MKTLLFLTFAGTAAAQSGGSWAITSSSLDGGGGVSTGGAWALTGTIGQPDATSVKSSNGTVTVQSGFWPDVMTAPGGPLLTVSMASPTTITIAWSAAAAGYRLQSSTDLQTWTNQGGTITGAASIPWPTAPGIGSRSYFRLIGP